MARTEEVQADYIVRSIESQRIERPSTGSDQEDRAYTRELTETVRQVLKELDPVEQA
jgi:hypothetical protein